MTENDASARLREDGIVLLRGALAKDCLARLGQAASRCFQEIESGQTPPERYRFSRTSHSVLLAALSEFGCDDAGDLTAPLSAPGLAELFAEAMGCAWACNLEQSWVRKKFAPRDTPVGHHIQDWHQDGALGVRFPLIAGSPVPMTELLTCWIPLTACGIDSPGLEFIRGRQPALLHFTELDDSALRRRFSADAFWTPALEAGDGLVFLNDVLHRTSVRPEMVNNRLSVEYRIFPC